MRRMRRPLPHAIRLLALGLACAAPLLLLEVGLRLFASANSEWNMRLGANKVYDPKAGFRNKPNYEFPTGVSTNEHGYLAPEGIKHESPSDALRLVYLGDSITFTPAGRNFPRLVEQKLEQRARLEVQTLNAAVQGYASDNARALFDSEIASYDGEFFFVYLGWNDIGQYGPEGLPYKLRRVGYRTSTLQRWISDIYSLRLVYVLEDFLQHLQPAVNEPLRGETAELYERYYPEHFERNLRHILRKGWGIYEHVYVVNLATITSEDPTPQEMRRAHFPTGMGKNFRKLHRLVRTYNEAVAAAAEATGTQVIDLYAAFEPASRKRYFRDSCHFTPEGTEIVAEIVAGRVQHALAEERRGLR